MSAERLYEVVVELTKQLLPHAKRVDIVIADEKRAIVKLTCNSMAIECKTIIWRIQKELRDVTLYVEHLKYPGGLNVEVVVHG